jgi:hypothetical protein
MRKVVSLFGSVLFASLSLPAYAGLITFSSRSVFNAAAPGLPVETFEAGLVAAAAVRTCNGPLSNAAASACFAAGALLPGVTYSAVPGPGMVVLGAGFAGVGNPSKVLGPNAFADTLNLTFNSANAVGFDFFPGLAAGNVAISVFSPANVLLNTFILNSPLGPSFFGLTSDTGFGSIGRINVASQSSSPGELVDNLAFGNSVPEPASIFLIGGGLLVLPLLRPRKTAALLTVFRKP